MNALRKIIDQKGQDLHIHLPDEFRGHRLEVLVVALDDMKSETADASAEEATTAPSPVELMGSLNQFAYPSGRDKEAGAWEDSVADA
jgi:hypothetical protein